MVFPLGDLKSWIVHSHDDYMLSLQVFKRLIYSFDTTKVTMHNNDTCGVEYKSEYIHMHQASVHNNAYLTPGRKQVMHALSDGHVAVK